MKNKIIATATASALIVGAALPVFAETSLSGSANAVINAVAQGYGINGTASSNANANVNAGNSASGSTGLGASIKALLDTTKSDETASSSGTTTASGNADVGAVVRITRANVGNNGATDVAVTLPTQVRTSADLSGYVTSTVKADENVQAVESASDKVSVTYKQHARFLGFIPVTLNARADVDAAGNVTIRYPWYSIFSVTDRVQLESTVQSSINATLGVQGTANGNANGTASLTAQQQAQIVAAVRSAMQSVFEASSTVAGGASGTVEAGADVQGDARVQ